MRKKLIDRKLKRPVKRLKRESDNLKQVQEVLWKSEEKYRDILQSIEELYYEVDLGGNLTISKTWFRKAYPEPRYGHNVISTWKEDLKIFKPGEKRSRVFTVTCKDGTEKIINFIPVQLETALCLSSDGSFPVPGLNG
jgi:PAS domain-containing protein